MEKKIIFNNPSVPGFRKNQVSPRKTRVETTNDEFNNFYYELLKPKDISQNENVETLLKEVEFYKNQFDTVKNKNSTLNLEISQLKNPKISPEESRITQLQQKNRFLEESVYRLKETLDKANELFPGFLKKLETGGVKNYCITEENNNNEIMNELNKIKKENKILKKAVVDLENIVNNLKNENQKLNEKLINMGNNNKNIGEYKSKIEEFNQKINSYINKITETQKLNEKYKTQIENLKQENVNENSEKEKINLIEKENLTLIKENQNLIKKKV